MVEMEYNDNSLMPFGKFIGQKLINVPAWYLLKLYDSNTARGNLRKYLEENLQALRKEVKRNSNYASR